MGARRSPGRWPRQRARGPDRCEKAVEFGGAAYRTPLVVPAKSVPSGPVRIQLGSLRSPEAAKDEWARLKREHPDSLGKLTAVAVRADLGDKGVWYRVQTQVFDDAAAADRLCADLKKQKIGCSLAH